MKDWIILLCSVILLSCNNHRRKTSSIFPNEETLRPFIGHTVGEFLSDKSLPHYTRLFIGDEPPGVAYCIHVIYKDSLRIQLIPYNFRNMKTFDENRRWDIDKFKREIVDEICVYKNDRLVQQVKHQ